MKSFTDAEDRSWEICMTLGSAMAINNELGIDLLQPEQGDPPLLTRIGTDELLLGRILLILLRGQFEKHQITTEQKVFDAFDGQTLLNATAAFYDELSDFFRSRGRTDRSIAVTKQAAIIAAGVAEAARKIEAVDAMAAIHGAMSGDLPESSESTPSP